MKATVFYGNGINRISRNPLDWKKLLLQLAEPVNPNLNIEQKPYIMIYEELLCSSSSIKEYNIKKEIQQKLMNIDISTLYEKLYELGVENYVTTNYDFSLESIFEEHHYKKEFKKQETLYSIRTHIKMKNDEQVVKIWHIHGDIERVASITLGLDQYCGTIGKIDAYLKGNYFYKEANIEKKLKSMQNKLLGKDPFDSVSWIELFYNTDVHIVGFGLDYSEIDIWWILNKRQRDNAVKLLPIENTIYYYDIIPQNDNQQAKHDLLKTFGVKLVVVDLNNNWPEAIASLLDKMKDNIQRNMSNDIE